MGSGLGLGRVPRRGRGVDQLADTAAAKATYVSVYSQVGYIAMGTAIVMLVISPFIKRMMHAAD